MLFFGDLELGVSDEGNNKTGLKEGERFNARLCSIRWRKNVNLITCSQLFRDRSLFITWGGSEDFGGDHLIFRRTEGGSVVTESPKGGITENFGRIQRGDHSNLLEQCQFESVQHKCAHSVGR